MKAASISPPRLVPLGVFLFGISAAHAAADGSLTIEELGVRRGQLCAVLRLQDAFDAERRRSIERGLPITVRFTTEIWRERRRWWDQQVDSRVRSYRVRWDPGERLFRLVATGRRRGEMFESLDALFQELTRLVVEVHPRWELENHHRYYVTAEAAIRPLTLEEFRELDGWISGRIRGDRAPSDPDPAATGDEGAEGDGGGIPETVFRFLVKWAGFGDTILDARTPPFHADALRELPNR
jgi:hypothetical protein